jgi:hypothetical protein
VTLNGRAFATLFATKMTTALARREYLKLAHVWDAADVDEPIRRSIPPGSRKAFHHFGLHPFPGRKDTNVIQTYLLHHTRPGDTVLDPFVGSGTTAREALILGRRTVVADINPVSELVTRGSILPVDFAALDAAYRRILNAVAKRILDIDKVNPTQAVLKAEIALASCDLSFLSAPLPKVMGRGVAKGLTTLQELHDPRQILGLLILRDAVDAEPDERLRLVLRLAFSRSLKYATKMYSADGMVRGRPRLYVEGNATPFRNLSYNLPDRWAYKNVWDIFVSNYSAVVKAKRAFREAAGDFPREGDTFVFLSGDVAQLPQLLGRAGLRHEAIADYCITDPPYAEVVPYPEVFSLWYAWLRVDSPDLSQDLSVVAGKQEAEQPALVDQFVNRLTGALAVISRAIRDGCWLTMFYQHKNLAYWTPMTKAAARHGLDFENVVPQPAQIPSFAKLQHPFATLADTMVVNFRRRESSRPALFENQLLFPSIRKYAELELQRVVVECLGADTETITYHLISVLLDPRLMSDRLSEAVNVVQLLKSQNLEPLGAEHRDRSEDLWLLKEDVEVDPAIDIYDRLRYDLFSYLRRRGSAMHGELEAHAFELLALEKSVHVPVKVDLQTLLQEFARFDGLVWRYSADARRRAVQPRLVLVRSSAPRLRPRLFGAPERTLRLRIDNLDRLNNRYEGTASFGDAGSFTDVRNLLLAVLSDIRDQFSDRVVAVHAVGELVAGTLQLENLHLEEVVLGIDTSVSESELFDLERALAETVFARVFLETGVMFTALVRTAEMRSEWGWANDSLSLLDSISPSGVS